MNEQPITPAGKQAGLIITRYHAVIEIALCCADGCNRVFRVSDPSKFPANGKASIEIPRIRTTDPGELRRYHAALGEALAVFEALQAESNRDTL